MSTNTTEIGLYRKNPFPNKPADFSERTSAQRMEWVMREMAEGDFELEKRIGLDEIVGCGSFHSAFTPNYFMFLLLVRRFDPEEVAGHVKQDFQAIFFVEAFGLTLAKPFLSNELWLQALSLNEMRGSGKAMGDCLKRILESRGAERIALSIHDKDTGALFAEIFGIKALSLLPPDLAKQVKGHLLEGELGL